MPLFNLNSIAVAAMRAALTDTEFLPWYVAQARESKALLSQALTRLGLRHWKSESNFVLVDGGAKAKEIVAGMIAGGVLVRDRSREHNCANCFRVTTGVVDHTKKAIALLETLCAKR
jgi:histidinol-phosphate aminotransferase